MGKRVRKKKTAPRRIQKGMLTKLTLVLAGVCILLIVLLANIMKIQYEDGERYTKIVLAQQDYDSTIIPYQRGSIVDAKDTVLAASVDVYNVILDIKVLLANKEDTSLGYYVNNVNTTVSALMEVFDVDETNIRARIEKTPNSQYFVVARRVSYEKMSEFLSLRESDLYKNRIYGVWFEKEYIRTYPYNNLAASVIGYASSGNVGVIGLENYYSSTLNGINGRTYGYLNSDSNLQTTTIDAVNGFTIGLSMDINIQTIVEEAILAWNDEHKSETSLGSKHTAVLVSNPNNGEILAMAQYPGFDLNNPNDLSAYFTEEELNEMDETAKLNKLNQIWQNFAVTYTYEPGSTAKPITIAAGLETGAINENDSFYCDGLEKVADHEVHCVVRTGHGELTVGGALNKSCNDCLMQMAFKMGGSNFSHYQSYFGVGQKTAIDLPGEASTKTLIYDEEGLKSKINLATNSFGQNFNVTMVQMASVYGALVNGGDLYQPHLVNRILDSNGNVVKTIEPVVLKKAISKETSDIMRGMLLDVVQTGTGKTAGVKGYAIGGKTGTAEKYPRGNNKYLVSFIGAAPMDDPQVIVYVIVDEPNVGDQAHSTYAMNIAHNIFEQILPYMNIEKVDGAGGKDAGSTELTGFGI